MSAEVLRRAAALMRGRADDRWSAVANWLEAKSERYALTGWEGPEMKHAREVSLAYLAGDDDEDVYDCPDCRDELDEILTERGAR